MPKHITPTIGRVVYYRGVDGVTRPAIITAVHGDFCVNLYVLPSSSTDDLKLSRDSVTHADPAQEPRCLDAWHWMPSQLAQADKAGTVELDKLGADKSQW